MAQVEAGARANLQHPPPCLSEKGPPTLGQPLLLARSLQAVVEGREEPMLAMVSTAIPTLLLTVVSHAPAKLDGRCPLDLAGYQPVTSPE